MCEEGCCCLASQLARCRRIVKGQKEQYPQYPPAGCPGRWGTGTRPAPRWQWPGWGPAPAPDQQRGTGVPGQHQGRQMLAGGSGEHARPGKQANPSFRCTTGQAGALRRTCARTSAWVDSSARRVLVNQRVLLRMGTARSGATRPSPHAACRQKRRAHQRTATLLMNPCAWKALHMHACQGELQQHGSHVQAQHPPAGDGSASSPP